MSDNYDGPQMAQKIMRQQVEIERLREEVKKSHQSLTWTVADNERLRGLLREVHQTGLLRKTRIDADLSARVSKAIAATTVQPSGTD